MATPIDPKRLKPLDRFIQNAREKFGPRPKSIYESKWLKDDDPEWAFKQPSSLPANMEAFRRDGMSYKMIPSDRIYANQWYANSENQRLAGYTQPVDPKVFKQEFIHRPGQTNMEKEMAQRAYDRKVGRDVARQVAENRMVQPNESVGGYGVNFTPTNVNPNAAASRFMRRCTNCGRPMDSGYVIGGGDEYYCSDGCLNTRYSPEQYNRMYRENDDDNYWTEFDD